MGANDMRASTRDSSEAVIVALGLTRRFGNVC